MFLDLIGTNFVLTLLLPIRTIVSLPSSSFSASVFRLPELTSIYSRNKENKKNKKNKKQQEATRSNKKQQEATRSNKKQRKKELMKDITKIMIIMVSVLFKFSNVVTAAVNCALFFYCR